MRALVVAVLMAVGVVGQAAPGAGAGETMVVGRVTAPDGSPIASARVDIVYTTHLPCGPVSASNWTYADAEGYYDLGVYPGSTQAKLRFSQASPDYASEWWPDKPTCSSAGWVDLSGGGTITVDAVLSVASISGVIRDAESGARLRGIEVTAFPEPYPEYRESTHGIREVVSTTTTDTHGRYDLGPLGPGKWRVRARVADLYGEVTHAAEWYGGSLSPDGATVVTLGDTSSVTLDFYLEDGNVLLTKAESVHGPELWEIDSDICLDVYEVDGNLPVGRWRYDWGYLALPDGVYNVGARVCDPPKPFRATWFGGAKDRATASVVEIDSAASRVSIVINLAGRCLGEWPSIIGTDQDDVISGTGADDVIAAGGGDDTVWGLGGDDIICLDDGNDTGDGGAASDLLNGGSGDDLLLGGNGADSLNGGRGKDTIDAGPGTDRIDGGGGRDTLIHESASGPILANLLKGFVKGNGRDDVAAVENLNGTGFSDTIQGDDEGNTLRGFGGDDVIRGLGGDDRLIGGKGDDSLKGGDGFDYLNGGTGTDVCSSGEELVAC